MWQAFLNKIGQDKALNFEDVMQTIIDMLKPIWESLKNIQSL